MQLQTSKESSPFLERCTSGQNSVAQSSGHGLSGIMVACILTNCITGADSM